MTQEFRWHPLTVPEAAARFAAFGAPWWIAGGWSIDLFLGRATREHGDLDVAILRRDETRLKAVLPGWEIAIADAGELLPWDGAPPSWPRQHQFWARPAHAGAWALEILLEDHFEGSWHYRRDRRITRLVSDLGFGSAGEIPALVPEVALLYKARAVDEPRNSLDFDACLPALPSAQRRWLREALVVTLPAHPWIERLS